jgi:Protein of unknown function (DUF3592)
MIAKRFVLVFLIWIGLVAIFLAVAAYTLEVPKYHRLASGGVQTKGLVVVKEPDNHSFIRYSYQVDQQQYTGLGNAGGINRPFEELNPGDSLNVYYDPTNPGSSLLGDAKGQYASIVRGVAFMTLIGPIFCLVGLFVKGWLPGFRSRK